MDFIILSDLIGIAGVILVLLTYFLLQAGKLASTSLKYSTINLLGSALIMVSLLNTWNLASVIIEIAWGLISCYGIYRYFASKNKKFSRAKR